MLGVTTPMQEAVTATVTWLTAALFIKSKPEAPWKSQ
jgi:hypothetical protein